MLALWEGVIAGYDGKKAGIFAAVYMQSSALPRHGGVAIYFEYVVMATCCPEQIFQRQWR